MRSCPRCLGKGHVLSEIAKPQFLGGREVIASYPITCPECKGGGIVTESDYALYIANGGSASPEHIKESA